VRADCGGLGLGDEQRHADLVVCVSQRDGPVDPGSGGAGHHADAFGNKTSVTASGVDIVTRTSTSTDDSLGGFATANANALGQGESWVYDSGSASRPATPAPTASSPSGATTSTAARPRRCARTAPRVPVRGGGSATSLDDRYFPPHFDFRFLLFVDALPYSR
jgi:hypothetical protein